MLLASGCRDFAATGDDGGPLSDAGGGPPDAGSSPASPDAADELGAGTFPDAGTAMEPAAGDPGPPDSAVMDTARTDTDAAPLTDVGSPNPGGISSTSLDAGPPPSLNDAGADTAPPAAPFVPRPDPETLPIFDESRVLDFHVSFPSGEWERLLSLRGEAPTRWVRCSLRFETTTFANAACRRKGNMFDWDRTDAKPQFVVRFNGTDPQGRFFGLRRLNFEHFSGWAAPVRDRLGMWLMREARIDAPRVNHARVWRDGQLLGVYQNVETVDHELLEDHFGPAGSDGNLWEGGVELETNERTADQSKKRALDALIEAEPLTGDHTRFWALLSSLMDIPQVLREMAGETALIAKDNFSNNLKNYYFYEHPQRGFLVLPWDFDDVLVPAQVDADPYEFWSNANPGKLRQLINQNPVWKASFVADLVDIRDNVLARMPAHLDLVCTQIRSAVAQETNTFYTLEEFDRDCADLRALIPDRVAALKRLLGR